MQDADLLVQLAGIAGVFVGFGALISVRSGGPSEAHEVTYIRSVVSVAIWVVVVALAPVIVNRYGVTGHELWLACSLVALVLLLGVWFVNEHTPETRELGAAWSRAQTIRSVASYLGLMIPTIAALILVVFGPSSSRARSLGSERRRDERHPHGDDDPLPLHAGPRLWKLRTSGPRTRALACMRPVAPPPGHAIPAGVGTAAMAHASRRLSRSSGAPRAA